MHPHVRFFVVGVAVGAVAGGLVTSVVVSSGSSAPAPLASAANADQVRQLAQACVSEARRQCMDSSPTDPLRERDRARMAENAASDLAELEKRALAEKKWTSAMGFRARGLVRRVPEDVRRAFEVRIAGAIDGGQVEIEEGAWKPGTSDRPSAVVAPRFGAP